MDFAGSTVTNSSHYHMFISENRKFKKNYIFLPKNRKNKRGKERNKDQ